MVGLLGAGAVLLLATGIPKLWHPHEARDAAAAARLPGGSALSSRAAVVLLACAEIGTAAAVLLAGGRLAAGLLAGTFTVLTAFSWRLAAVAPEQGCGCFHQVDEPSNGWHIGVNAAFVLLGVAALLRPTSSVWAEVQVQPWFGLPFLVLTCLLAYATYLAMAVLPRLLTGPAQGVAR